MYQCSDHIYRHFHFCPFDIVLSFSSHHRHSILQLKRGGDIFQKKKKEKKKRGDKTSIFFSSEPTSNRFNIIVDDNMRLRKRRKTIHVLAERRNSTRVERENVSKYLV